MRWLLPVLVLIFFVLPVHSQQVASTIDRYGDKMPAEKLHLHFDKEMYLPGETAWFKAYVFEEHQPSARSTSLYVVLYDALGQRVATSILPIINATASGSISLPASLSGSQVICRAYTGWMLNFDSSFLFSKTLRLYTSAREETAKSLQTSLQFFPEGGDLIGGERNTIAFKAAYSNGSPYSMAAVVKKADNGETVAQIQTQHDGMGRFDLETETGGQYYAEWTGNNGVLQKTFLPPVKNAGVSFKMVQQKNRLVYNVVSHLPSDSLHILAYLYQTVVYAADIPAGNGSRYTGKFLTDSLPDGVLQLTVFDQQWQPVAERVCFINNHHHEFNAGLGLLQINTGKRTQNELEIIVADSIPASLSLSVTDAGFDNTPAGENIYSSILLKGDIRGYIHKPAYYFDTMQKNAAADLDLLMMTHGWRRYNWDLVRSGKMPPVKYYDSSYLGVNGKIDAKLLSKLPKDEMVNLIVKTKDSTTSFYSSQPGKNGLVKFENLLFYDSAKLYYSFNFQKENNKAIEMHLPAGIPVPALWMDIQGEPLPGNIDTGFTGKAVNKYTIPYTVMDTSFGNAKTMQGVTVKSGGWHNWKNNPLMKMDEKYTQGLFSGGANTFSLDLVHDESAQNKIDIYAYIRNRIPGLQIGKYDIANGRSLSYLQKSVNVYIDEQEMTYSDLENLSISQVAYIKLIPSYFGRGMDPGGSTMQAALSVYTRKGSDVTERAPKETDLAIMRMAGYSPVKEFYMPDYSQSSNNTATDTRTTLLWLPDIDAGRHHLKIPVSFYNSDVAKSFKIVLEGINQKGQLIHLEKIVE
ncbi:MAG: hypothetical protein U0V75_03980 [Ferruginibacter sp.]